EHRSPKPGVGSSSLSSCAKRKIMKKLKLLTDIEESYTELRYKTSWPTKGQLIKSAIIVMIASIIIAFIIWCMDQVVDNLMHFIYSLGK
ncbi:preprotein translocase subunit SecE, partial [Paramuribaculum intestinale]